MNENQQFLLYTAPDGAVKVEVFFKDETAWLTQKALAELFGVKVPAVNKHLKNIFGSGELVENAVISILETTAEDGKFYSTKSQTLAILAPWRFNQAGEVLTAKTPSVPRRKGL
jgi:hypothetical protein